MSGRRGVMPLTLVLAAALGTAGLAAAVGGRAGGGAGAAIAAGALPHPTSPQQLRNVPYDGRLTFARIRFSTGRMGGRFFGSRGEPPWAHDYPFAERNLMRILAELTMLRGYDRGGNIFTTDDPELTRYPVAYMAEPGFWNPSDKEVAGLRDYLLKGGFLILDDFSGWDWENFAAQMRRVLPEGRLVPLNGSEPIFRSFFEIDLETLVLPSYRSRGARPEFWGIFQDNDSNKRLVVLANYNADIGEHWEYAEQGWYPVDLSNEAYKLGINFMVYALTH